MRKEYLLLVAILTVALFFAFQMRKPQAPKDVPQEPIAQKEEEKRPDIPLKKEEPKKEEPKKIEPNWTYWPKVRDLNRPDLGKVLQDIESHMPAGHHFSASNKITWAHETTHGINANIRNKHFQSGKKVNGLYCLEDRAVVIEEPKTTINKIAQKVPNSLRGNVYKLYLIQQQKDWNNEPLYLCDEWVAYTNGSACGRELNAEGWYYEILLAHEFNIYCLVMAQQVTQDHPAYDHTQLKAFMMWNTERTFQLAQGQEKALAWAEKFRTTPDAEDLRQFARQYFGTEWCKRVYGF